eukprot:UN25017
MVISQDISVGEKEETSFSSFTLKQNTTNGLTRGYQGLAHQEGK